MTLPKNIEIKLPLNICEECCNCYPEVIHAYTVEEFGGTPYLEHYEIVCKFETGCVYAYEKGTKKNG